MRVVLTTSNLPNFRYTPPPTSTRAQQAVVMGIIPVNYWSSIMAKIFTNLSKVVYKIIIVIERVYTTIVNVADAYAADKQIVREAVEAHHAKGKQ